MTEVKKTGVKGILEMVKAYYGFAGMLLAIGSIVYAAGIKRERVDSSNATIVMKVNKLIANDSSRAIKQDTILARIHYIRESQGDIRSDMTSVTGVVKNLSKDVLDLYAKSPSVTKNDLIDVMQNLQFDITEPKVNKSLNAEPEFKITVKKMKQ